MGISKVDILPGEEQLHERLQLELMDVLTQRHQELGMAFAVQGPLGAVRSVEARQADPSRYEMLSYCACEFIDFSEGADSPVEPAFLALRMPEKERTGASVIVLAKLKTLLESSGFELITEEQFDDLRTDR